MTLDELNEAADTGTEFWEQVGDMTPVKATAFVALGTVCTSFTADFGWGWGPAIPRRCFKTRHEALASQVKALRSRLDAVLDEMAVAKEAMW
jgi:hypothetical protein